MQTCRCKDLPTCVRYGEPEKAFVEGFELLDSRPWLRLYGCRECGVRWQLDVDDRSNLAIKVPNTELWKSFNDRPVRRAYFIDEHGGEGEETCLWAGCKNRVLKYMAICVDHAFPE